MYSILVKTKKSLILLLLFSTLFYGCRKKIEITPQISEYQSRITEADKLYKKGSYASLKEAFALYQDLLSFLDFQIETREKLTKTTLLLAMREKELAILGGTYLKEASQLIQNIPESSKFTSYVEVIELLKVRNLRITEDRLNEIQYSAYLIEKGKAIRFNNTLKEKAMEDEFIAYLYLSLNHSYSYVIKEKADIPQFLKNYPDSLLIKFLAAINQNNNEQLLKEIIEMDPSFTEVYYFLGENALSKKKILNAEKYFIKAYQSIPQSASIVFSLAGIYSFIGELEKSLEFYDKTIILAPKHRRALLGKAICLSKLGKYEEAIIVLNELLALGKWYLGDTHFWLAWNQNALKRFDEGWENIENSKLYLTSDNKVFTLAGIIAFNKEQLETAEKNFKKAITLDRFACQALFYLGRIYSARKDWIASGFYYAEAADCYEVAEDAIKQKINELESSALSEERKRKLILKKERQLEEAILSKAIGFYNAAACYLNAKFTKEALACAEKAVLHPSYKEKAEELISKIKELK